ncbi:hypothetical protein E2C01_046462 [Portunus trituberculatus]|uniref:Uncharacterized protein n=1 Tax=Portunus trituberculatus TaxID=210409 RepID=A0A5B7FYI1_PORTR|nr:hypothetical protein [Portunus trituberculatus]
MVSKGRGKPKLEDLRSPRKGRGRECAPLWKLNSQRIYYSQRS